MPVLALVSSALIAIDTLVVLPDVEISCGRDAYTAPVFRQAQQVTVTPAVEILNTHAIAPKDVAVSVPNMVMPDYGSAMTSSVYIRGIGSRIDEPVMGMVVDGIPLLDKNLYDFRLQDVRNVEVMLVTVFPEGKTTGRMMANAAKARSFGVETSLRYSGQKGNWSGVLHASYGFTDARFVSFNDGRADYSGNHIPYAPAHTMSALFN